MSYISQIKLPNNTTYDINSKTVNGHTVASDVPSNAVFTDTNNAVTQTSSTTNSNFEILLSGTADDVTRTEGVKKSQYALFNPNKKAFTFGTRAANSSIGEYSTSEGSGNTASGAYSHVEGLQTSATYSSAHAEGAYTSASGGYAHAEGYHTTASVYAHAEGNYTTASGYHSHAEGYYTTATHKSQHVFGEYNVLDTSSADSDERGTYVEIVGKGTADNARSNARTLDWSGNEVLAGNLTIGGRLTAKSLSLPDRGDLYLFGYSDTDTSFAWLNNNKLSVHDYDTEHSVLELTATDLIFPGLIIEGTEYDNTWDGTHSSLKDTITYLSSQSAANKVSKTGDTMSGDISWNDTTGYTSGLYWKEYGYGDKFKIAPSFSGFNDDNFLGFQAAVGGAGTDPSLTVILKIHPSGKITTTNQVIGKNPASSWIGARDAACFRNPNFANNGSYYPVLSTKSKDGTWSIGVLSNENNLRFCYESDTNYNAGTNASTSVVLRATAGTIALTSEIPTWGTLSGKPSTFTPSAHSHTLGTTGIQVKYRDYKPTSSGTSLGIAINTLPTGYVFVCWVGFQSVGGTIGHPEWDHSASSTTAYFPQGYVANVTERFFYLIAKSTIS